LVRLQKVGLIVFPGMEELDLVGVWEVLGATNRLFEEHILLEKLFQFETLGATLDIVKCAHGLSILPDKVIKDLMQYDVIVVPGGPGRNLVMENKILLDEIRRAHQAGKLICSVCTGTFVLAEAGILKGKMATTFHTQLGRLSDYGIIPVRERVVSEDNILTGAGIAASIDVGLRLVEIFYGNEAAEKVAQWIEYQPYRKF